MNLKAAPSLYRQNLSKVWVSGFKLDPGTDAFDRDFHLLFSSKSKGKGKVFPLQA
jgi:hypothetical protein